MISLNGYDIDEEFLHRIDFVLDEDAFDDTRVCFKSKNEIITGPDSKVSLGPCDHMCCKLYSVKFGI